MATIRSLAWRFLHSEDGPSSTEYAAMLALIVLAAVGAIGGLGAKVDTVFTTLASNVPTGAGS